MFRTRLPPPLFDFLSIKDIVQLSMTNRQIYDETKYLVHQHKQKISRMVISKFHYISHMISTSFQHMHIYFQKNMKLLLYFIPELFEYIQQCQITHLDLTQYLHIKLHPNMNEIADQIIDHLAMNQTLTYCNLNIFHNYINTERLKHAVQHHPTLELIEINLNYFFDGIPGALYRLSNGEFQWRFDRPN